MKKTILTVVFAAAFILPSLQAAESNALLESAINKKATISAVSFKISPFCLAIAKGDLDTVKKLIALGADVNEQSQDLTPAMYAARYNRTAILKLLIENGANLETVNVNGLTARKIAKISGADKAVAIIDEALSS